ncbi:MAG: hypothetical protein H0W01_13345 [Pseudonocardiales bacterium]|nr:hypothetical protein [Pseudonocardiales bacterium]
MRPTVDSGPAAEPTSRRRRGPAGGLSEGLSLSLAGAVGSFAGFISWLIAARIMPQEAVGYASAFVSGFLLVAGAAQLNLDAALMLWLPRAGRRAPTLLWRSYRVILPICILVGLVYVAVVPSLARTAAGPDGPIALGIILFVIAAAGWGLWGVHDYALLAIGRTWWAPWRNVTFALVRIGLLVALGASFGAQGIVLSWVIPIVVWTVGSLLLVRSFTGQFARAATTSWMPKRTEVFSFLGPTTIGHLGTVLLSNQVTLLVIQFYGPEPGAAFFIAWQAVLVIDITANRFMQPLSAHLAREPERAKEHVDASRRRLLIIFLPVLAIGMVLAEKGLQIFGPGYAQAATVLRVLLVGLAFRLLIAHELGRRQALSDGMGFARLQLVSTLLVIGVVIFIPVGDPGPSGTYSVESLVPVALGYAAVQMLCAATILLMPFVRGIRARMA